MPVDNPSDLLNLAVNFRFHSWIQVAHLFKERAMIPTFTLLMTVLAGPAGDTTPAATTAGNVKRPVSEAPYDTVREAREAVKSALRDSHRAGGRDAAQTAPTVLAVHRRVGVSE